MSTIRVPIIPPLTARAGAPTVSVAPSANVITISGVQYVNIGLEDAKDKLRMNPPKVTHAFLAMISE